MKRPIPASCQGVKCMVKDCTNLSEYKIGEENVYDPVTQPLARHIMDHGHNMTSYLCDYHFKLVMTREENYIQSDSREFGDITPENDAEKEMLQRHKELWDKFEGGGS